MPNNNMYRLDVPTKRGVVLNGVLFRPQRERKADTVMIAMTGIHGNFYSNPFYYNVGDTLNGGGIDESAFTKQYNGEAESVLAADLALTRRLGIYSLPSYLISCGDRALVLQSFDYRDFENAIEKISR